MARALTVVLRFVGPAAGAQPSEAEWADPEDEAGRATREAAARALERALADAKLGLRPLDDPEERAGFLAELMADGVPPEIAATRLRRRILLVEAPGRPADAGALQVEVADRAATASLVLSAASRRTEILGGIARLEAVAALLRDRAGLALADPQRGAPLDEAAAARFPAEEAARLIRSAAAETRRGWLWFAGAQATAALLVGGLWAAAASDLRLLASIDMDRPLTLLVEGRAPLRRDWGVFERHPVVGRVIETGAPAEALVRPREWHAARKGARLMVFEAGLPGGRMASVADVARAAPVFTLVGVGVPAPGAIAAALIAVWLGWLGWFAFALEPAARRKLLSRLADAAPALLRVAVLVLFGVAALLALR